MRKVILTIMMFLLFAISPANVVILENGATSVITYFVLRDRVAGTVDVGVTIANIDTYYIEEGALISAKTDLAAHGAGDDAWDATEQGYHMGYGVYRIDWENAAFDGGIGTKVQLIVIDGDAGAFTEIMEIELSPPVDIDAVDGVVAAATNMEVFWDVATAGVNLHDFFGNATAYANYDDMYDGSGYVGGTEHFHVDAIEIASTAAETVLEAEAIDALESFELDNLLSVTTGVVADGDLEDYVSAGTVMAHLMGIGADVSTYNATEDSQEALGTHADATTTAATADAVWDEAMADHQTWGTMGWLVNLVRAFRGY